MTNLLTKFHFRDFLSIRKTLTCFTSWWSLSCFWAASRKIQRCHDLVEYGMAMYLLLVRCSIARGEQRLALRWQYNQAVALHLGKKTSFNYSIRSVLPQKQPSQTSNAITVHQPSDPKLLVTPHYRQPVRQRVEPF